MFELLQPWFLLLLPLPFLIWKLVPAAPDGRGAAVHIPCFGRFTQLDTAAGAGTRGRVALTLKAVAWGLLVLAASQPVWIGPAQPVPTRGRDLMLALDLSGSMETPDFEVEGRAFDRLSVVRAVAQDFVRGREGDRLGLVLFGSRAYLQAPLTLDRPTLIRMLDEAEIGLAGEETAIGDAIGLAVKQLRTRPADERVLVLLSDGASNAGSIDPLRASELAAEEGVRVYTIGLGTGAQLVQTPFGAHRLRGEARLDEATLRGIAERTGGVYFPARDTEALLDAHRQIDALEMTSGEDVSVRPMRALFHWPLAAAFGLTASLLLLCLVGEVGAHRGEGTDLEMLGRRLPA